MTALVSIKMYTLYKGQCYQNINTRIKEHCRSILSNNKYSGIAIGIENNNFIDTRSYSITKVNVKA